MRTAPNNHIYDLWNDAGPFIGDDGAAHGRVTIEPNWQLRKSVAKTFGSYDRGPLRYFQLTDNSQIEYEIPNVKTIDIDRSVDTDAATMKFVMVNQKMLPNGDIVTGTAGEIVGQPGVYWPGYGDSTESTARWGQEINVFNNLIQPNALVRVYQGYGGRDKTIEDALSDGNIILTGVFLVDQIDQDARTGLLTVSCRDMAKLLIEQTLYPPLVPVGEGQSAHYPLNYYRWVFVNHPVIPYGDTIYKTGFQEIEECMSGASSSGAASGHPGTDVIDGADPSTYWMSAGRLTGGGTADFEYLEFNVSTQTLGGINIQPYGGNYVMYVSVMVGGSWQGTETIPTTAAGMAIPYVRKQGLGWETAATVDLGQEYASVTKIRVTFTHLAKIAPGPLYYAAGVRILSVGAFTNSITGGGRLIQAIQRGSNTEPNGYWLAGSDGGIYTFGDLRFYGAQGGLAPAQQITGMASNAQTGKGYRLCGADGGVFCFGDLYYKGSLPGRGITTDVVLTTAGKVDASQGDCVTDMANGDVGSNGYYLLRNTGSVNAFGDANHHGHHILIGALALDNYAVAMASVAGGYYTLNSNGNVQSHGAAVDHGSPSIAPGTLAMDIETTSSGDGYWVVSTDGAVFAFGDANYYGGPNTFGALSSQIAGICRSPDKDDDGDDDGYWVIDESGGVFSYPTGGSGARFYGSLPEQYSRVDDGNYEDYVDIVKDLLLWSGWWFRNPALGDATPANVFGGLESTGIYAPDNLTEEFFDKKPVIDVINTIKEIVGYISYADDVGSWQFKTPNVWSIGNFMDTGVPTARMPVVDEKKQIIDYRVGVNDTDARSQIIIATEDPALGLPDTKSVTITSQWGPAMLRGIVRPAMWVNGAFLTTEIQRTMAELIDLHLFMQQRQGSLTMPANPILQIDDQVRVYERNTSDVYIHYVRGYSSHMDLEGGEYTQTLQLHWMGDGDAFFLNYGT